ncbi:hypothetical protein RvY_10734 [Ramazzottius varieornatus]|uniref:Uncharacterized protein n=1 Tax=Ramazzottius varieornatus TaxID=947166 RepID=A0A1D1VI78_RAMVA|nr:hypothetical protein RvY_10734 [Ramazzottius varieornatus]
MTAETQRLISILTQHKKGITVRVEKRPVQMQTGGTDGGLVALAITTEFLLEKDPSEARFHQASMRKHFEQCLEVERIERAFPPAPCHSPGKSDSPAFEFGVSEHVQFKSPK